MTYLKRYAHINYTYVNTYVSMFEEAAIWGSTHPWLNAMLSTAYTKLIPFALLLLQHITYTQTSRT